MPTRSSAQSEVRLKRGRKVVPIVAADLAEWSIGAVRLKRGRKVVPIYDQHITVTPGVRGGKPCISGRRISVADVATWHLQQNRSVEEIVQEYDLTHAQVYAALTYYYDYRAEIDASEAEELAQAEALRSRYPLKLQRKLIASG